MYYTHNIFKKIYMDIVHTICIINFSLLNKYQQIKKILKWNINYRNFCKNHDCKQFFGVLVVKEFQGKVITKFNISI